MKFVSALVLLPVLLHAESNRPTGLEWLVGCWETTDHRSTEVWVAEPDGSLIGFAVSVSDAAVVFYELLRITTNAGGDLTYTAYPSGQSPATFVATESGDTALVFVNANHDYPQEIAYRVEGARLLAKISALGGENPQSFDKVRCE